MKIIGISGKAGHGKDTVAAILADFYGFTRRAYADALKEDMFRMLVKANDNQGHEGAWLKDMPSYGMSQVQYINSIKHYPEIRALLQGYGVAQRKAQPDYWIQRLFQWAEAAGVTRVVIPDVRFVNEAEAIKERGGILLRVNRPGYDSGLMPEQLRHPSETDLDNYKNFDYHVLNAGGLNDLRRQLQGNGIELYARKGEAYVL